MSRLTHKKTLPAFAECPVQKDGDECEKGTCRSSRLQKNIFGGQVSVGGYASAGLAGAVKMTRAEARGGFTPDFLSEKVGGET